MPFKSDKQRKYMFANLPEIAERWAAEYKHQLARNGRVERIDISDFEEIGEGSYSKAYAINNEVFAFTTETAWKNIDASKEILVKSRKLLSKNAIRFVPEIERHKITAIEFYGKPYRTLVYKMPMYQSYRGKIDFAKSTEVDYTIEKFRKINLSQEDISGISECLECWFLIAKEFNSSELDKYGIRITFDFAQRNLAMKNGQLILLDPFFLVAKTDDVLEKWRLSLMESIKLSRLKPISI